VIGSNTIDTRCNEWRCPHNVWKLNAYHRRFRQWLARFHGVASHYLPNYLGWRWALDGERIASPERFLRAAIGIFHTE